MCHINCTSQSAGESETVCRFGRNSRVSPGRFSDSSAGCLQLFEVLEILLISWNLVDKNLAAVRLSGKHSYDNAYFLRYLHLPGKRDQNRLGLTKQQHKSLLGLN